MIIAATDNNISEIKEFCKSSLLGNKIICLTECYGFGYDFLKTFLLYDESNALEGIFTVFYGNVTVFCDETADVGEIKAFLELYGFASITAEPEFFALNEMEGYELKQAYKYSESSADEAAQNAQEKDYKEVYNLISKNIPGSFSGTKEAYLSWLSDFTFRNLRGFARMKCVRVSDLIVSCALTAAESEYAAIISGVACSEEKRKSGAGKSVVLTLADELKNENKDVYVIALNSAAEGFYEHIGFEKYGSVAIMER